MRIALIGCFVTLSFVGGSAFADCQNGPVFDQPITAMDKNTFVWTAPADVDIAIGFLSDLGTFSTLTRGWLTNATSLETSDQGTPDAGTGVFYLVKLSGPPCGSWQSVPGAEPSRDALILPPCSDVRPSDDQVAAAVDSSIMDLPNAWVDPSEWNLLFSRVQAQLGCALDLPMGVTDLVSVTTSAVVCSMAGTCDPNYDPLAKYCGTCDLGKLNLNHKVGPCLNQQCYCHDNCYQYRCYGGGIPCLSAGCAFAPQSQFCDGPFFANCDPLSACRTDDAAAGYDTWDATICEVARWLRSRPASQDCTGSPCGDRGSCGSCPGCVNSPSTAPYLCSHRDGTGNLTLVWINNQTGTDAVYFNRYDTAGNRLLANDVRVSAATSPASIPSCGVDSSNNTHVGWKENDSFMYAKLSSAGTVLVSPKVIKPSSIDYPHIDTESGGNNHIVWVYAEEGRGVRYEKRDSSGNAMSGCGELVVDNSHLTLTTEYPFILSPGSGNNYAFISWHGNDPTPTTDYMNVSVAAYPGCTNILGPFQQQDVFVVGRSTMVPLFTVSNSAYLVFEGTLAGTPQHVYWQTGAGTYFALDLGAGPADRPSMASLNRQDVLVVWEDNRSGITQIYSQTMNGTTSTPVGSNCLVSPVGTMGGRPSVARAGASSFAIAWEDGSSQIQLAIRSLTCPASADQVVPPSTKPTRTVRKLESGLPLRLGTLP
jgi:hypothetical protein